MSTPGFAELAARSHYSFLEGSSSPRDLVAAAAAQSVSALGLCDRNGLYGAVTFVQAAQAAGIHPVIGAELDLVDGSSLRLLARDREGYRQLARAISAAQLAGEKGQPRLDLFGDPHVADENGSNTRRLTLPPPARPPALRPTAGPFPDGWPGLPSTRLLATGAPARLDPAELSGCIALVGGHSSLITAALMHGDRRGAARIAGRLREAFGRDRVALLVGHHLHPADNRLLAETAILARRCGIPIVASNTPVHATAEDKPLLDVLTAIRHRTTLDAAAAHGLLIPNAEHRVKDKAELRALLGELAPEAFDHAAHLAAQCQVSLDFTEVRFPGFPVPPGETPFSVLYRLCQESVQQRYRPVTRLVAARLQRELDVIEKTGLAEFFLITWDIMRFAREQGIPGQGRGSAADSIVAYLLGITRVDPVAHNLLFERFLHEDHQGTPDIDIDFSTDHREEVLQYVYQRYGAERTGMVANIVTFRPRMAIRQVGAALGFPDGIIDRLAKSVGAWYWGGVDEALAAAGLEPMVQREKSAAATLAPTSPSSHHPEQLQTLPWAQFLDLLQRIESTPRHLGIHTGGMLVTGRPLIDIAPVERATMPGRVVVQFNKDDVEDLGLIKMDLLGLRTLSVVKECLDHVEAITGERPDLDDLPLDDPRVYDTICAPDTIGLFQIESRAQQQSLYKSQPREFNDLVVQVAIIRPGPIQGDAVHPYLRRRQGLEPVTYLHPALEPILSETRGVILYQEQILRLVMEVAGYSAGEADRFRRAMNRHRSRIEMEALHDEFTERCRQRGLDGATTDAIFKAVAGFAQFGFCKSHAAAFARTAYETAWLRLHHHPAYLCALLNAQPMGFYHPSVLVEDAKRHGVVTLPVDAGRSRARCSMEWVGEGPPSGRAVRARLAPGWRCSPEGAVEPDLDAYRPSTVSERAADHAVHDACRAVALGGPRHGLPRSSALGAPASPWAVRLGFNYVRGLGPAGRLACEEAARAGAADSVAGFWQHTRLPRPAMENLVMVGAFEGITAGRSRRALLWELREIEDSLPPRPSRPARGGATSAVWTGPPRGRGAVAGSRPGDTPRPEHGLGSDPLPPLLTLPAPAPALPVMDDRERVAVEYRLAELSTGPHLVAFLRERLNRLGCTPIAAVSTRPNRSRVRVAGLVIARQAPVSAKGFRFFTLADEGGHIDLVFRPRVLEQTRSIANFHPLLAVDGVLESDGGRLNILVEAVRALDATGRVIAGAAFGRGAPAAAPRPQHGHTRPTPATGWTAPASHDYR